MLTKISLIFFLALMFWPSQQAMGQDEFQAPTASQIRARKLANQWKGSWVEVRLIDGNLTEGKLISTSFSSITIARGSKTVELPLEQVESVTLPPGLPELMMVAVTTALGGALGYGLMSLANPEAEAWVAPTAAGISGLVLGFWGLGVFYTDIRYDLREE